MSGVFAEHCLEHFSLGEVRTILAELRRVLAPEGLLRVIVPDAELYLRAYVERLDGNGNRRFPYEEDLGLQGIYAPIMHVNRVYYQDRESLFGHRVIFDFAFLREVLLEADFSRIVKTQYRDGACPTLLVESESRRVESLYVEAWNSPL